MKELGQEGFIIRKFCFKYDSLHSEHTTWPPNHLLLNKIISVVRKKNKRLTTEIRHFEWMKRSPSNIIHSFFCRLKLSSQSNDMANPNCNAHIIQYFNIQIVMPGTRLGLSTSETSECTITHLAFGQSSNSVQFISIFSLCQEIMIPLPSFRSIHKSQPTLLPSLGVKIPPCSCQPF